MTAASDEGTAYGRGPIDEGTAYGRGPIDEGTAYGRAVPCGVTGCRFIYRPTSPPAP
jgi:hypothetical protein